jgi:hypothetical protein
MADTIDIEIMDDGVIKIKTTALSEANHISADDLLNEIEELMGGTRVTEKVEHEFWKNRTVVRNRGKIKIRRT